MARRFLLGMILVLACVTASAPALGTAPAQAGPMAAHVARPSQAPAAFFDKTRVVLHLGLAFGAFHHWVWNPYRAGNLSIHHPLTLVKAGAALLFAVHELKVAQSIAANSNSATLKALNGALVSLTSKFQSVGDLFHKPSSSLTDNQIGSSVNDLNNGVDSSKKILNVPDAPASALPTI